MNKERRVFERDNVEIPFIFSPDEGDSFDQGAWQEAVTEDIGPVLLGGMAFYYDQPLEKGQQLRIALNMNLELRAIWLKDKETFPIVYLGTVCRVNEVNGQYRIAVVFEGFEKSVDEKIEALTDELE